MHYRGNPNRHLRGLLIRGGTPERGEGLEHRGKEAGVIGSVGVDPRGDVIALAVVKRKWPSGTASKHARVDAELLNSPLVLQKTQKVSRRFE